MPLHGTPANSWPIARDGMCDKADGPALWNTEPEYPKPAHGRTANVLQADRNETFVLLALIHTLWRWLMPPLFGVDSALAPVPRANHATYSVAIQHPLRLVPIHAPPPPLLAS